MNNDEMFWYTMGCSAKEKKLERELERTKRQLKIANQNNRKQSSDEPLTQLIVFAIGFGIIAAVVIFGM